MFSQWEIAVALARDVVDDCQGGRVDVSRVARMARTVVEFQEGLLGRGPPPRSSAGASAPMHERR